MSSLGKLLVKRPATPRKESRPFSRRLSRYEPREFRADIENDASRTGELPEYRPPSVYAEHKLIVIVFAILCLGLAAYWVKSVATAPKTIAPAAQSVYIEMVPTDKKP